MADPTNIQYPGVLNPEKSERGVAYIPLPRQNISFLSPNEHRFTGYISSACGPIDKTLTPLFYEFRTRKMLTGTTEGSLIDLMQTTSVGLFLKIATAAGVGITVLFNLLLEYVEQKKAQEKREEELQNFRKLGLNGSGSNITTKQYMEYLKLFDKFINEVIQQDDDLREKYAFIETNYPDDEKLPLHIFEENIRLKVVAKDSPEKDYPKDALYTKADLDEIDQALEDLDAPLLKTKKPKKEFSEKMKDFFVNTLWESFLVNMVWNKALKPLYTGVGFLSFAYWALTIPILILTGVTAPVGIFGISNWISFLVLPAAVLAPYFGIRVYNWVKNGHGQSFSEYDENARLKAAGEEDFVRVMGESRQRFEFESSWNQYMTELTRLRGIDATQRVGPNQVALKGLNRIYENPYFTAPVSGVLSGSVNQVGFQYISWVTADIVTGGLGIVIGAAAATPIGWALLGLSGLFCLVSMGYRYVEGRKAQNKLLESQKNIKDEDIVDVEEFERRLAERQAYLAQLKTMLYAYQTQYEFKVPPQFSVEANVGPQPAPTMWEKILNIGSTIRNHPWIQAWDKEMNSIFIARILVPAGVAVFWSVTAISVLAALSNPITFAVIGALGTAITAVKYYEKYQKKKEEKYQNLLKTADATNKLIALGEVVCDTHKAKAEDLMKQQKENYDSKPEDVIDKRVAMQPYFKSKPKTADLNEGNLIRQPVHFRTA